MQQKRQILCTIRENRHKINENTNIFVDDPIFLTDEIFYDACFSSPYCFEQIATLFLSGFFNKLEQFCTFQDKHLEHFESSCWISQIVFMLN